jgi:hypothetical protein
MKTHIIDVLANIAYSCKCHTNMHGCSNVNTYNIENFQKTPNEQEYKLKIVELTYNY